MNDAHTSMRTTFVLGRLFGIRVGVHASWIVVYVLATLSIAGAIGGVPRSVAVALAAACALLLFVSVIAHEFAHALVARRFGVRTRAITLFLFGGVATLECEPGSPRAEVFIALAGPALSALLAGLAFGLLAAMERWMPAGNLGEALGLLVAYVALANGVLAAFNLVPAFPMDGGRVLRAAIWRVRKSRAAATGAASIVSLVLAGALIVGAAVAAIGGHSLQDVWYVLIGGFLLDQGRRQLRESRAQERLERVRVGDVMELAGDAALPVDAFSLSSSATALEAVSAFRASDRLEIAIVDAGRLTGWLHRERMLAFLDSAA